MTYAINLPDGFIPPNLTTTERDAIVSPVTGALIFNTTTNQIEIYDGTNWIPASSPLYFRESSSTPSTPVASGTSAVAIGSGAEAKGNASFAIGSNSYTGTGSAASTALGNGARVEDSSSNAICLGNGSVTATDAIGLGTQSIQITGAGSVGIGPAVQTGGDNSIAIGYFAQTGATNAVAIGSNATNTVADTVVIGGSGNLTTSFIGDTSVSQANSIYIGTENTNDSWRFQISGSDLVIQRRVAGVWTTKTTITG